MKKIDYFLVFNSVDGKPSIIEYGLDKDQLRGLRDQLCADNEGHGFNDSVKAKPPMMQTVFPYYFMIIDSTTPVLIEGIHFKA